MSTVVIRARRGVRRNTATVRPDDEAINRAKRWWAIVGFSAGGYILGRAAVGYLLQWALS